MAVCPSFVWIGKLVRFGLIFLFKLCFGELECFQLVLVVVVFQRERIKLTYGEQTLHQAHVLRAETVSLFIFLEEGIQACTVH